MSDCWAVEKARSGEGNQIARLVRASLAPAVLPLTIWASPRVDAYVEEIIAGGFASEAHEFYVLRGEKAAGVAAFRWLDGQAFLNHLYIVPRFRGRSLGRRLLADSTSKYLEKHPAECIGLDMFAGTRPAGAWYARLGFRECGCRAWWLEPESGCTVRRAATCIAGHSAAPWGFSSFEVHTVTGRRYEVGCLHKSYFRLTQPEAASDVELRQVLRIIDPDRRLLLIGPEEFDRPRWRRVALSRRLECDTAELLARLLPGNGRTPPLAQGHRVVCGRPAAFC